MISKIIFLKTPKCAGTSIKKSFICHGINDRVITVLPDHRDYYNNGTRNAIEKLYIVDLKTFNYEY